MVDIQFTRYTFWKDHFRYFVRADGAALLDPEWDTDGASAAFVHPPQDGVIGWRLPHSIEVIAGKEAGEIDVDVAWLASEPAGIYETHAVASACDIETPTGRVAIADHWNTEVVGHDFGAARRCRVLVEAHDRDLSSSAQWGAKTDEHHTIIVWPMNIPQQRWTSVRRDATAIAMLDGYLRAGIDPELGQRDP
jgi:hypothetical protein